MSLYRYYLNAIEVFPINDSNLKYKFLKQDNGIILEKTLESSLTFKYTPSGFNFQVQEANDKCVDINLLVNRVCTGGDVLWFEGVFAMAEGEFDNTLCTFTVKPRARRTLLNDVDVNICHSPGLIDTTYGVQTNNWLGIRNYKTARRFDSVLLFIAQKSNPNIPSVISNFFQINPDGAFYLPTTNYWDKLAVCPLSDIQEPIPSNAATKCLVTFKQLMDDLNTLFDVYWYIDTNFNLRLEHKLFFEGIVGLDLTQAQYDKFMAGTDKYSYDIDDSPKEENWKIQGHSQSVKVKYGGTSNIAKGKNAKTYSTNKINTDLVKITLFDGGAPEDGIFMFATDGGVCGTGWCEIPPTYIGDYGRLGPEYLVRALHVYRRPDLYGIFSANHIAEAYDGFGVYGGIIFESIKPIKKQIPINFPLCCGDELNLKNKLLTDMGEGYIEEATFETKSGMLNTTLKYEVENCNEFEPSDLSDLRLWLKHNDWNNPVTQWNDSSGNALHAVLGGGANSPVILNNGLFFLTALNRWLVTPAFTLFPNKRGTVIILFVNAQNFGIQESPIISTNGGAGSFWDLSVTDSNRFKSASEGLYLPTNNNFTAGYLPKGLLTIKRIEDTFENITENSEYAQGNSLQIPNLQPSSNPLIIGTNAAFTDTFGGAYTIQEIIIYDRALNDAELEKIEFYLVKKGIYTIIP